MRPNSASEKVYTTEQGHVLLQHCSRGSEMQAHGDGMDAPFQPLPFMFHCTNPLNCSVQISSEQVHHE